MNGEEAVPCRLVAEEDGADTPLAERALEAPRQRRLADHDDLRAARQGPAAQLLADDEPDR